MLKKLPLKGYIYAALALDLLGVIIVLVSARNLPPLVPLFYGAPVGSAQLVTTYGLTIAPLSAIFITTVNSLLASRLDNEFLRRILSIASFFVSSLAFVTIIKIISLVGFW